MVGWRSATADLDISGLLADHDWSRLAGLSAAPTASRLLTNALPQNEYITISRLVLPSGSSVEAAINSLAGIAGVAWAAPNFIYDSGMEFVPNDPRYASQYHHTRMQTSAAWDVT